MAEPPPAIASSPETAGADGIALSGPDERRNPFPGPQPFSENDHSFFFGRERELSDLENLLFAHRVMLLHAPSGAGKSSLVRAGLMPRAQEHGFEFLVARLRRLTRTDTGPGADGNRYIRNVVDNWRDAGGPARPRDATKLADVVEGLSPVEEPGRVIVFDQFEELFVLHPEAWRDRGDLFKQVREALDRHRHLRVLFVMRDDYLAQLEPFTPLLRDRLSTRYHLEGLSTEQAVEAIVGPFAATGREFAPSVAEGLVSALRAQPSIEPDTNAYESEHVEPLHLQIVCRTFFDRLPPDVTVVSADDVERHADVGQALGGFYEDAVAAAVKDHRVGQAEVRRWFERQLITPAGTRGIVFQDKETTAGLPNEVVEKLEEARVIRSEPRGPATWFELAHDSLIRPVLLSNREWREKYQSPLQKQAELWNSQRSDGKGLLLRDNALEKAAAWAAANEHELTDVDRAFLAESQDAAERERKDRRNAMAVKVLAIATAVALLLSVIGWFQATRSARAARRSAALSKAQELLGAAEANRTADPTLSLLLTRAAVEKLRSSGAPQATAAQSAVYEAVHHGPDRLVTTLPDRNARGADFSADSQRVATAGSDGRVRIWAVDGTGEPAATDPAQTRPINAVAFSRDGTMLAAGGEDGTTQLFSVSSRQPRLLLSLPPETGTDLPEIRAVAFDTESRLLATADESGGVTVWNVASPTKAYEIPHTGPVRAVSFSPDGKLATGADDGSARVWDLARRQAVTTVVAGAPKTADENVQPVTAVAFSGDGARLATASTSGRASVWEVTSGRELLVLPGGSDVNDIAFGLSAEEGGEGRAERLTTATVDGRATVWDGATGRRVLAVGTGLPGMGSVALSPDGRRLVTTNPAGAPAVWDASGPQLEGHTSSVYAAAFHPDGQRIATASADGTATIWDITDLTDPKEALVLSGHAGEVNDVAFSSDGATLVTAGDDRVAKLWDAGSGSERLTFVGHADRVRSAVFTPDGRLVTASADQLLKVWDLASGRELATVVPNQGPLWDVAVSADGSRLATAGENGSAKVWDSHTGAETVALPAHRSSVRSVSFSPDGTRLVTAGTDKLAKVWDLTTRAEVATLPGEDDAFFDAAFSPDGARVALGGDRGLARVWVPGGPEAPPPLSLAGHPTSVSGVAFSADGSRVVTTSSDQTAQIWDAETGQRLGMLTGPRPGHRAAVTDARFTSEGERLATASADGTVKLWAAGPPAREGAGEELHTVGGYGGGVTALAFSPDDRFLATVSDDHTVRVWPVGSSDAPRIIGRHEAGGVNAVAFSPPDGAHVATGGDDGTVRLWSVDSGKEIRRFPGAQGPVNAVAFSPDGKRLAGAGDDKAAHVWDVASGDEIPFPPGVEPPRASKRFTGVAFSPDGLSIATASEDGTARVWGVVAGKSGLTLPNDDRTPLSDVVFSRDGSKVAAAGEEVVLVWKLSEVENPIEVRQSGTVRSVAFSPDGKQVVAAIDTRLYRYPMERRDLLEFAEELPTRDLSEAECKTFFNTSCDSVP